MVYHLAAIIFRAYIKLFYGLSVYGRENVPKRGGAVAASNHISAFDPPVVGISIPREIHYMAKKELFKNPFMRWLVTALRSFPVDRDKVDSKAVKEALRRLKRGIVVGIFPEGTRNPTTPEVHDGAAYLAQRAGVPLIPIALWREGKRFCVCFGEPIYPRDKSKQEMRALTQTLMIRIRELIDEHKKPADKSL